MTEDLNVIAAFNRGYDAYNKGKKLGDNPYWVDKDDFDKHVAWEDGWKLASADEDLMIGSKSVFPEPGTTIAILIGIVLIVIIYLKVTIL